MVLTRQDAHAQKEAVSSAFRHYGIAISLTPKVEDLVTKLGIVDVRTSSVRCQGQCVNGGTCSQNVNQYGVMRALLQIFASDKEVVGSKLDGWLETVYAELLCGSANHCTEPQIARCISRAKPIIEAWRAKWIPKGVHWSDCKKCAEYRNGYVCRLDSLIDAMDQRTALRDEIAEQEKFRESDLRCNTFLLEENLKIREERKAGKKQIKELQAQLQTLQLRHDGLVGRLSSEVEEQKSASPSPGVPQPMQKLFTLKSPETPAAAPSTVPVKHEDARQPPVCSTSTDSQQQEASADITPVLSKYPNGTLLWPAAGRAPSSQASSRPVSPTAPTPAAPATQSAPNKKTTAQPSPHASAAEVTLAHADAHWSGATISAVLGISHVVEAGQATARKPIEGYFTPTPPGTPSRRASTVCGAEEMGAVVAAREREVDEMTLRVREEAGRERFVGAVQGAKGDGRGRV